MNGILGLVIWIHAVLLGRASVAIEVRHRPGGQTVSTHATVPQLKTVTKIRGAKTEPG